MFLLRSRLLRSSFGKEATEKKRQILMSAEGSGPPGQRTSRAADLPAANSQLERGQKK